MKHIEFVHEGVQFPCSQCEYRAPLRSSLTRHKRSIHEGIKFPCKHCELQAAFKIRSIHEGVKFPCCQCEYEATQKGRETSKPDLTKHIESVHEGVSMQSM